MTETKTDSLTVPWWKARYRVVQGHYASSGMPRVYSLQRWDWYMPIWRHVFMSGSQTEVEAMACAETPYSKVKVIGAEFTR